MILTKLSKNVRLIANKTIKDYPYTHPGKKIVFSSALLWGLVTPA